MAVSKIHFNFIFSTNRPSLTQSLCGKLAKFDLVALITFWGHDTKSILKAMARAHTERAHLDHGEKTAFYP